MLDSYKIISKDEAVYLGLTRFYTGAPCLHGHVAERLVSNVSCIPCSYIRRDLRRKAHPEIGVAAGRIWAAKNREHIRAIKNAWNAKNRDQQKVRSSRWYAANKDKANEAHKRWALRNPGKINSLAAKRRADELLRTPVWAEHDVIDAIYERARLMREAGFDVHVDHFYPLRGELVSGLHVAGNLQIIDGRENQRKSNRLIN